MSDQKLTFTLDTGDGEGKDAASFWSEAFSVRG